MQTVNRSDTQGLEQKEKNQKYSTTNQPVGRFVVFFRFENKRAKGQDKRILTREKKKNINVSADGKGRVEVINQNQDIRIIQSNTLVLILIS